MCLFRIFGIYCVYVDHTLFPWQSQHDYHLWDIIRCRAAQCCEWQCLTMYIREHMYGMVAWSSVECINIGQICTCNYHSTTRLNSSLPLQYWGSGLYFRSIRIDQKGLSGNCPTLPSSEYRHTWIYGACIYITHSRLYKIIRMHGNTDNLSRTYSVSAGYVIAQATWVTDWHHSTVNLLILNSSCTVNWFPF